MVETNAVAIKEPTPGIAISRWQTASSLANCLTCLSACLTLSSRDSIDLDNFYFFDSPFSHF
ncbi:MAG: hypothetical protein GXP14_01990 [Gammaproteobacteria bacterium]|nr:hypothetical protein [Gammaproteobacteria bacterium]